MLNKTLMIKLIGVILVLMLSLSNFLALVSYAAEISSLSDIDLSSQDSKTNNKNIEFNSYLRNGERNAYSATFDVASQNSVYINLKLSNSGYLKTGVINFEEESFNIKKQDELGTTIQNIDYERNEIVLNQINGGTEVELEIPIEFKKSEIFNIQNLNKNNKVVFTGTYVTAKGKEVEIKKEILLNIKWDGIVEARVEQEISKYINDLENMTLLELKLNSCLEQNTLPLKETSIEIEVPEIEGKLPEYASVVANSLVATTGVANGIEFGENNFEYNKEEKKIKFNIQNLVNEHGQVAWENGVDEYRVIFVYERLSQEEKNIVINTKASFDVYGLANKAEKNISTEVMLNKKIGDVNGVEITSDSTDVYKSFMYANSEYETEYSLNWKIDVGYAALTDKIVVSDIAESFVNTDSEKIDINNNAYYKQTIISKKNFEKILGGDGFIKILNEANEELANITLNITEDENIVINYGSQDLNKIKIETSKPQTEGCLEITHVKAIKAETDYEKDLIKTFTLLENEINLRTTYNKLEEEIQEAQEIEITNINAVNNISLLEPEPQIELKINKEVLKTDSVNEDVEIYLNLINNDKRQALFNNPVFDIRLPEEIDFVQIKDIKLIFEEELDIQNTELFKDENGIKHIRVTLSGAQSKYNIGNIINGASLVITSDINLKDIEETKEAEIEVICLNENVEVSAKTGINLVKVEVPKVEEEEEVIIPEEPDVIEPEEDIEEPEEVPEEEPDSGENIIPEENSIELNITSNIEEDRKLKWGEIVKYTIEVKNTTSEEINDLKLSAKIPEGAIYAYLETEEMYGARHYLTDIEAKTIVWNIGLKPNEVIKREYEIKISTQDENITSINNNIYLQKEEKTIAHANIENMIEKGYVELFLFNEEDRNDFTKEDKILLEAMITKTSDVSLSDTKLNMSLPDGFKFEEAYISKYDEETLDFVKVADGVSLTEKYLEMDMNTLNEEYSHVVKIVASITDISLVNDTTMNFNLITNGVEHNSNKVNINIVKPKLEVYQTASIPEGDIKKNEIVKFVIKVKNTGEDDLYNVEVEDCLPKNMLYLSTEYTLRKRKKCAKSTL